MLKLLTRKLNTKKSVQADPFHAARNNRKRLTHLKNNNCRLLIKLDGNSQVFQSLILSVDELNKTLLIDDLFPTPVNNLNHSHLLHCEYHENGLTTSFSSQLIKITRINGLSALLINYPDTVEQEQRRGSFRLPLQDDKILSAKLTSNQYSILSGIIKDISNNGIRINIHGNKTAELAQGDILNNCKIMLDESMQIECQLTVRNKSYFNRPYRHTQIGAEITNIQSSQRNLLTQYVIKQQRQQRRLHADISQSM